MPERPGCTAPKARRTPAASPWSPRCAARPGTTSSTRRSMRCATSSTAAPSAPTREPATAPASSPRSRTRSSARSPTSSFPHRAATPSATPSCPPTRTRCGRPRRPESLAEREGLRVLGWREVPVVEGLVGPVPALHAALQQLFVAQATEPAQPLASACHRPGPPDLPPAQARRARARGLLRLAVLPHHRLQGHGHDAAARAVLPRPLRRALHLEARPRALALLHQHLPVLAARAAVPHDRAQRRDQHRAGQPQLDARPPVAARIRAARRPRPRCSRSSRPAPATPPPSTRSSSCSSSPAAPCRTRS